MRSSLLEGYVNMDYKASKCDGGRQEIWKIVRGSCLIP